MPLPRPRPPHDRRGVGAWVARLWRALLSEVCATALLVWLGLAAAVPLEGGAAPPLAHVACAFGFVVVGCAVGFGPASGAHMNPAVSLAAALVGQLAWPLAAAYVLAQTLGAVLGFAALLGTLPVRPLVGVTRPAASVGPAAALALEAALTGLLALACCGAWAAHDPARPDPAVPIKLGLLVAGLIYAGGSATGASLNPARSFAPALLYGHWEYHWVYWVGPLGGAALAAVLHRHVLTSRGAVPPAGEAVPLDHKARRDVPGVRDTDHATNSI